jgi:hypothetical protein
MNFRVEEYAETTDRVRLVPVEMRGFTFEGSVADGDRVRASGRMRSGTLRVKKLHNLTTGADVSAKQTSKIACAFVIVFFVALAIFAFVMAHQHA